MKKEINQGLNVQSTVHPEETMTQDQWMEQFQVSAAYTKPTIYYTANHYEPVQQTTIFNRILRWIDKIS